MTQLSAVKRRALLASAGATLLAGCGGRTVVRGPTVRRDDQDSTTTFDGTPASDLETRPVPEPPADATADAAADFVRKYERAVLRNDVVEQAAADSRVTIDVSPVRVDVLADLDGGGVLVASDGSASNRHGSGGYTRNRALVVHHVDDGSHRLRQYNAYRCARPAVEDGGNEADDGVDGTEGDEVGEDDLVKLQVYDFADGDAAVSVAVRDRTADERVFFDRYGFETVDLVVQPGIVAEPGSYEVSVASQSGGVASLTWEPEPGAPSWWGLTAFVLPDGNVLAGVLDPEIPPSFEGDLCHRRDDAGYGKTLFGR